MKQFYRVCNTENEQGLWYDFKGRFTGLIHDTFNFCKNNELKMDYDQELTGYLSATENLETLFNWFTKDEILKLQDHGYYIHVYETNDFKFYDRFKHMVISQVNSKLINVINIQSLQSC